MSNKRFWDLPACSKLDVLKEGEYNHVSVMLEALADKETLIERIDRNTYSIYGTEESLLIKPISSVLKMSLFIYASVLMFIHKN